MAKKFTDHDKPTVWLIEDGDRNVERFKTLLENDFNIRHFKTNDEAAKNIGRGDRPDIILVDYDTGGGMKGVGFITKLRGSSWKDIPAIGVSSVETHNSQMFLAGADGQLDKELAMSSKHMIEVMMGFIDDNQKGQAL